ncbi:MAG TPA: hypothetical protein VGP07_18805 [Polyangia bacterium]|jgi:hypothetical protein
MRRWHLAVVVVVVVVVGLAFLWKRPGLERFEIPAGYHGQVVVFFSHPRGVSRHGWGWTHVYEIPKDGVLFVRDDPPRGFNVQEWLYVDSDGRKTSILSEDSSTPTSTGNETRVRGGELRAQTTYTEGDHARAAHSYRWIEAQIGRPADETSFGTPAHFVVEQVIEELRRQDRQGSGTGQ